MEDHWQSGPQDQSLHNPCCWCLQHLCNVQAHFASAETDVGTEKDVLTMRPQSWVGRAPWQLSVADRTRARFVKQNRQATSSYSCLLSMQVKKVRELCQSTLRQSKDHVQKSLARGLPEE